MGNKGGQRVQVWDGQCQREKGKGRLLHRLQSTSCISHHPIPIPPPPSSNLHPFPAPFSLQRLFRPPRAWYRNLEKLEGEY